MRREVTRYLSFAVAILNWSTSSPLRRSWHYIFLSQSLDISAIVIRQDSSHSHRLYYSALDTCSQRLHIIGGLRLKKGVKDGPLKSWSWRLSWWE
ncbi:MAG: hypothetical protein Q9187_003017 [Circinaria calcarea]